MTVAMAAENVAHRRWQRPAGYAIILIAVAFLAWSAWSLWQAGGDSEPNDGGFATARDQVTRTAAREILILNSMDGRRVDASLAQWLDVTTGPLHETLKRDRSAARARFAKAGTTARANIAGLAVTSLDTKTGNATVIASLRIRVTDVRAAQQGTEQRKRYQFALVRTPSSSWKIKSLTALPATGT